MLTRCLLLVAVLATCGYAIPRRERLQRLQGNDLIENVQIGQVLRTAPSGARLINTVPVIPALVDRLPDNATLIRANIVDNFRCIGKDYGYYGDVDNECQIFHVCLPLKQLYPANFTSDITYQFSFICPAQTVFSQDAMVCAWESEALPCEFAPDLYWMNKNFFRPVLDTEKVGGTRYAEVNEPLTST